MLRSSSAAFVLGCVLGAQSPLVVAPAGAAFFDWPVPPASAQTFFDLTVHTAVTLRSLATPLVAAVGQPGTLELWLTNPGILTHVGNETNPANWHRAATGSVVGNGTAGSIAQLTCTACLDDGAAGLVLAPGSYGCAIRHVGVVGKLCAVPVPTSIATSELTVSGGAVQYNPFLSPPAFVGGGFAAWSFHGRIDYGVGVVPHACASARPFGYGCLRRHTSVYSYYTSAQQAANDLNGQSLTFLPDGVGGYRVMPGLSAFPYQVPSSAAVPLPASNDGENVIALSLPFPWSGGLATSLYVHANGFVSVAPNGGLPGYDWLPSPASFLAAPATGWWAWHDFNATEAGSGRIWWEEDLASGVLRVTWLGVESYPAGVGNPSTLQMVFDGNSGIVTMHLVALDPLGGSTIPSGDRWLVGYSPGGASVDPGSTSLAAVANGAAPPVVLPPFEVAPLSLAASAPPLLGTTIDLLVGDEYGASLGLTALTTTSLAVGLDLASFGAPGCSVLVDIGVAATVPLSNVPTTGLGMVVVLPIPNQHALLGARVFGQSVWLDPTANALGLVTSNGLELKLGNQ